MDANSSITFSATLLATFSEDLSIVRLMMISCCQSLTPSSPSQYRQSLTPWSSDFRQNLASYHTASCQHTTSHRRQLIYLTPCPSPWRTPCPTSWVSFPSQSSVLSFLCWFPRWSQQRLEHLSFRFSFTASSGSQCNSRPQHKKEGQPWKTW